MKNDEFNNLEIYIINLDSSQGRYQRIDTRLKEIGFNQHTRISAVCKNTFSKDEFNRKAFFLKEGKRESAPEVACYLSHYKVIQGFMDSEKDYALILEDDMIFNNDFKEIIRELLNTSFKWDMVKFNASSDKGMFNFPLKNIYKDYFLKANLFPKTKSGAYIINKKAASNYLRKLLPMEMTYDHEFIKYWKYDIRQYSLMPMPSKEEYIDTTIPVYGKDGKELRFSTWKRIPVLFYRFFYVQILRFLFFYKLLR